MYRLFIVLALAGLFTASRLLPRVEKEPRPARLDWMVQNAKAAEIKAAENRAMEAARAEAKEAERTAAQKARRAEVVKECRDWQRVEPYLYTDCTSPLIGRTFVSPWRFVESAVEGLDLNSEQIRRIRWNKNVPEMQSEIDFLARAGLVISVHAGDRLLVLGKHLSSPDLFIVQNLENPVKTRGFAEKQYLITEAP